RGVGQGLPGALDVFGCRPAQRSDDGPAAGPRHLAYRRKIIVGRDRKPGLDHVHTKRIELARHAQFLLQIHTATRRLLTITQRRIEYDYSLAHGMKLLSGRPDYSVSCKKNFD